MSALSIMGFLGRMNASRYDFCGTTIDENNLDTLGKINLLLSFKLDSSTGLANQVGVTHPHSLPPSLLVFVALSLCPGALLSHVLP